MDELEDLLSDFEAELDDDMEELCLIMAVLCAAGELGVGRGNGDREPQYNRPVRDLYSDYTNEVQVHLSSSFCFTIFFLR
jgi:hypothetical protein